MLDLSQKISNAASSMSSFGGRPGQRGTVKETQLDKLVQDSNKIAGEERTGLLANEVKAKLFNGVGQGVVK